MEGLFARGPYDRGHWAISLMFEVDRGCLYEQTFMENLFTSTHEVRCSPKLLIKW